MRKIIPISGALSALPDQNTPAGVWVHGDNLVIATGGGNLWPLTVPGGASLVETESVANSGGGLDRDTVFKLIAIGVNVANAEKYAEAL